MPNNVVIELARQTGRPVVLVEKIWRKAKKFVADEGEKGNFLRVLEVSRRMLGLTSTMKRIRLGQRVQWRDGDTTRYGTVESTLPDCCFILVDGVITKVPLLTITIAC